MATTAGLQGRWVVWLLLAAVVVPAQQASIAAALPSLHAPHAQAAAACRTDFNLSWLAHRLHPFPPLVAAGLQAALGAYFLEMQRCPRIKHTLN